MSNQLKQAIRIIETLQSSDGLRCSISFSLDDSSVFTGLYPDVLPNALYKQLKGLGLRRINITPISGGRDEFRSGSTGPQRKPSRFFN